MIDFRKAGETGRLYRGDRCRSEAAERLPHDITRIRDSVDDPPHELQGLLIKMRRRQTARIINPWSSSFHRAFNAFHTTQGSQLPHISNSMRVTPLVSQSVPVFAGNRGFSIKGIIRPARFGAILVSVGCQALHHLTWRPVPEPILREVLAGRGVPHSACFVGLTQWEPRPLPLIAQPLLYRHPSTGSMDSETSLIKSAHLRRNREAADRLAIDVSSNMSDPFVPGNELHVIPAVLNEQRVNRCPAHLGVPEPKGGCRRGITAPRPHMRPVPINQAADTRRVSMEPPNAVRAITHHDDRCGPGGVGSERITAMQHVSGLIHAGLLQRRRCELHDQKLANLHVCLYLPRPVGAGFVPDVIVISLFLRAQAGSWPTLGMEAR